jgi:hypothetical protein
MTPADFQRIALSFDGAEQSSHMGATDFRVGGRIFATLASVKEGYGNLMLSPEQQADFVAERPDLFVPVYGGWGRMGATHIKLALADEDTLHGALQVAWTRRLQMNRKPAGKKAARKKVALKKVAFKRAAAPKPARKKAPPRKAPGKQPARKTRMVE